MARTIAEVSKETLVLQSFLESKVAGSEIAYQDIEMATGVHMDLRGKGYLRSALRRSHLEHAAIRGQGIKLADAQTALPILGHKMSAIGSAVRRTHKTHKNLTQQFYESLPPESQKRCQFVGTMLAIFDQAGKQSKLFYAKEIPKAITSDSVVMKLPKIQG